jgi:hypothetical protein
MIGSCGTVCHNRKETYANFRPKHSKLKKALRQSNSHMLTGHTFSPADGNFLDEHGNAIKHYITEQYNTHTGHVNRSDRITKVTMSNSYGVCQHI